MSTALPLSILLEWVLYGLLAMMSSTYAFYRIEEKQAQAQAHAAFQRQLVLQKKKDEAERIRRAAEDKAERIRKAAEDAENDRQQREKEEGEYDAARRLIREERERKWKYAPNSLFLGTYHAHPLAGKHVVVPVCFKPAYDQQTTELPVWFTGQEMGVTIGINGSQKFTAAIAPNILLYDGSCFIIDPKGEVCAVTAHARREQHKQPVYRLDPFNQTVFGAGAYVPPLTTYNPLDVLDPSIKSFPSDVATLVEALITPRPDSSDPIWADSSKELLIAMIIFVCTHRDAEGKRNLCQVYEYLSLFLEGDGSEWLLGEMEKSIFRRVRGCASIHKGFAERTRSSIVQQARTEVMVFADAEIEEVTSTTTPGFRLEDLFEKRCTLYLILPADRLDSHNRWLRLMMTVSLMTATRYKHNRTLWVIDEAAQLGRLSMIPKAYSLLRGYGVRIWTFWQDLGQLQSTYPDEWRTIIGNSFVQLMACGDKDTAEYFANLAGKQEVEKVSVGLTKGVSFGDTRGSGQSETRGSSDTTSHSNAVGSNRGSTWGGSSGQGGGTSSWGGSEGKSTTVTDGTSRTNNNSTTSSSNTSQTTTQTFSETVTRSWQLEERIRVDHLIGMSDSQMYLRCPKELPGFLSKYPYYMDEQLNALAMPNPYLQLPGINQLLLEGLSDMDRPLPEELHS